MSKDLRAALQRHVHGVAAAFGVEIVYYRGSGKASRRGRRIEIPEIRGRMTYLIALHELGHIIGPARPRRRLEREMAAWEWALGTSLVEPTPANYRGIVRALTGYQERAERRSRMVIPPGFEDYVGRLRELAAPERSPKSRRGTPPPGPA